MNFDTLGVHLGTFRVAQKCQKGLKVPLFSQKCLGRIFGLLFEKIGLLFDQTVWSHCTEFKMSAVCGARNCHKSPQACIEPELYINKNT